MNQKDNSNSVNKNGVSVASDGSGFFESPPVPLFTDSLPMPDAMADLASATEMTGIAPTTHPKTEFPDYDNFTNLGMK